MALSNSSFCTPSRRQHWANDVTAMHSHMQDIIKSLCATNSICISIHTLDERSVVQLTVSAV